MKIFRYTAIAIFITGAVLLCGFALLSKDPTVRARGIMMACLCIGLLRFSKTDKK